MIVGKWIHIFLLHCWIVFLFLHLMNDFTQKGKVVITCKDRFAPYLEEEVKALGFRPTGFLGQGWSWRAHSTIVFF